jgi:hypothetical protein
LASSLTLVKGHVLVTKSDINLALPHQQWGKGSVKSLTMTMQMQHWGELQHVYSQKLFPSIHQQRMTLQEHTMPSWEKQGLPASGFTPACLYNLAVSSCIRSCTSSVRKLRTQVRYCIINRIKSAHILCGSTHARILKSDLLLPRSCIESSRPKRDYIQKGKRTQHGLFHILLCVEY